MKKGFLLGLLLLAGGAAAYFTFASRPQPLRVLVFSRTEGYRHEAIAAGKQALLRMAAQQGFRADTTEDAAWFHEDSLRHYHAVVFLLTTGDVLNEAQQTAFMRFIQAGGGYVGLHSAADTEYDWLWYGQLVGGYFNGHPGNPNVRPGALHVADSTHAATQGLPRNWNRTDEWYDYRAMQPDLNVLLTIDETSYKRPDENPAAQPRPIAWYHDFEGGRAFYSGLGHTAESYTEPLFLQHLWGGLQYAAGNRRLNYDAPTVRPEDNRFTKAVLDTNLDEPMELEVLPDGRILFIERHGAVKIHDPAAGTTTAIDSIRVNSEREDGLLGFALAPDFATSHHVYFFYSPPGDEPVQHVSRFVLDGDSLHHASEQVVFRIPVQRVECCHAAGALEFGPDSTLYISTGDNTNPFASDGYAPIDERPGRSAWDAQGSSANANDLRGKVLRIRPEADGTYSIPDGNLFPKDGSAGRPEIYVMGCRNPFRIAIDAHTGWLYWGDVGPDATNDHPQRGPRGHDEVNQAQGPGFFGWPYFNGNNKPYFDYDFATGQPAATPFDPTHPVNPSPNNTGPTELPPAQPAWIWYPYGPSPEFSLLGTGGRTAIAGAVYHYDDYPDSPHKLPRYYDGKLFIFDWIRGWIMAATLHPDGSLARLEPFAPHLTFDNPVDMVFSPRDGALYMLEYGRSWNSRNLDARLFRIDFNGGNRAPLAQLSADRTVGAAPLTVQFDATASSDHDGDALRYRWQFDSTATSTEAAPTFTYTQPGLYTATLTVTDAGGLSATQTVEVLVGNTPPAVSWQWQGNRSFFWPEVPVDYAVQVEDAEQGTLAEGRLDPQHLAVTFEYLPDGIDPVQVGHAAQATASVALVGEQQMAGLDCLSCHRPDTTSVGPSFQAIGQRYRSNTGAATWLATKVINGGSGVWGEVMMPAHPTLTEVAARRLVAYILSVGAPPAGAGAPPNGTFRPAPRPGTEGAYLVTATYTDAGGQAIGPLTGQARLALRHPRLQAEQADTLFRAPLREAEATGSTPPRPVVAARHGGFLAFHHLDLTGIQALTLHLTTPPELPANSRIEVRRDGPDGTLLGTLPLAAGTATFRDYRVPLTPTSAEHDLYLVFRADASAGTDLAELDWLYAEHR
jgi:cytochrome c